MISLCPQLEMMYFYVTRRCNMSCKHCWVDVIRTGSLTKEVTIEQLRDVLYEAKELGLRCFKITGGEPFTRKGLINALIELGTDLGLSMYIETNGSFIDEDEARFLEGRAVGISISLDFPDERHDEFRRFQGAFNRAIQAMKLLSKHSISWLCIMTVTRENFADIPALAKLVISLGATVLKVHPCLALGRAKGLEEKLLTPVECLKLVRVVAQLDRIYEGKVVTSVPLALVTPYFAWPRPLRIGGVCHYKNLLSILPDGSVALCGIGMTHPEAILGSIHQNRISEIWQKAEGYLAELRNLSAANLKGICSTCVFKDRCANSCPAYVYEAFKTFSASHPLCEALYQAGLFPKEYITKPDNYYEEIAQGKFLGVWEAARYLDFPVDLVYDMLEQGELPGSKVEGRWRVRLEELDSWLDEEAPPEELEKLFSYLQQINASQQEVQEFSEHSIQQGFCNL